MKSPLRQQPDSYLTTATEGAVVARLPARAAADRRADGGAAEAPRLVIRGESSWHEIIGDDGESYIASFNGKFPRLIHLPKPKVDGVASAAIVDYLNCVFPFTGKQQLQSLFSKLLPILGAEFSPAVDRLKGLHGYLHSFSLGQRKTFFAYGGNRA